MTGIRCLRVSFLTIGVMWVNHRSLFSGLARVDRVLLFLNLLLLLFVVAVPFTTATFADYLRAGGSNAKVAAALYGVVMTGTAVSFGLIFAWALGHDHMIESMTPKAQRKAQLRFGAGTAVYLDRHRGVVSQSAGRPRLLRGGRRLLRARAHPGRTGPGEPTAGQPADGGPVSEEPAPKSD